MLIAPQMIVDNSNSDDQNDKDLEEPSKTKRKKQIEKPKRTWIKTDLKSNMPDWTPDNANINKLRDKK